MAQLGAIAGRLACVQRLKPEVADDGEKARVDDEGRVAPVVGVARRVGEDDDNDERDGFGNRSRNEYEDRVADRARAELGCGAFGRVGHAAKSS